MIPSGFLAGEGVAVFDVLYDERYQAGGPMMMILCVGKRHIPERPFPITLQARDLGMQSVALGIDRRRL